MSKQKPTPSSEKDGTPERLVSRTLLFGGIAGGIGLVGYPLSIPGFGVRLEFIGILVALAAFITGFFTGTLFGMPKRNAVADSDYSLNNSLVEISDWLTKIIVGLGLVNLQHIPKYLMNFGTYVSEASGIKGQSLDVFSMCSVAYFAVFGLYIGYNYMRLVLSQKYKVADDNVLRKQLQDKDMEIEKKEEQKQQLIMEVNKPKAGNTANLLAKSSSSSALIAKAQEKLNQGLLSTPSDPQKGQWGGKSVNGNRKLTARVDELSEGVYTIYVTLAPADATADALADDAVVLMALHPSFGNPPIRLVNAEGGTATLKLYAYGSFTIGAFAEDGVTELELDLAEVAGVSDYFKKH